MCKKAEQIFAHKLAIVKPIRKRWNYILWEGHLRSNTNFAYFLYEGLFTQEAMAEWYSLWSKVMMISRHGFALWNTNRIATRNAFQETVSRVDAESLRDKPQPRDLCLYLRIAFKYDKCLCSITAETSVKLQSGGVIIICDDVDSKFPDILL